MASYWTEVLADSPKVLLRLDEASGDAADSSGNGHTGTATGSPTYHAAGPATGIPWAVTIASGSYFSIADHADVDLSNGPFTIEGWYKRPDTTTAGDLLGKADGSATAGYIVNQSSTDFLRLEDGSTSAHVYNASATTVDDTAWHHFCYTRASATNAKLYIDGTNVTDVGGAKTFTDNNLALLIGKGYSAGTSFAGVSLAGIAIYKSELTPTRVTAHYGARNNSPDVSASAGIASATGASGAPAPKVRPEAPAASPTVAASAPTVGVTGSASMANAGHAVASVWASQGTGSDLDIEVEVVDLAVDAGSASADIGTPAGHLGLVLDLPQHGWDVGAVAGDAATITSALALDATAGLVQGRIVSAGLASATFAANDATATPAETVTADAELVMATAAAASVAPNVMPAPDAAGATAAANSTLQNSAQGEQTTATVASQDADAAIAPSAAIALATGGAETPSTSVEVNAGIASAAASVEAIAIAVAMHPELASAIGEAFPDSMAIATSAGLVTATGEALDVGQAVPSGAQVVSATGAAWGLAPGMAVHAGRASASVTAQDPAMAFTGMVRGFLTPDVAPHGVLTPDTAPSGVLR